MAFALLQCGGVLLRVPQSAIVIVAYPPRQSLGKQGVLKLTLTMKSTFAPCNAAAQAITDNARSCLRNASVEYAVEVLAPGVNCSTSFCPASAGNGESVRPLR